MQPIRTAEVIAVGSELLGSTRLDTNSLFLSQRLAALGVDLRAKSVVGDSRDDLAAVFRAALPRVDLVILTGGLGPTDDDITRDVVAEVLGLPMSEDASIVARIQERFARRGMRMPEVNRRQGQVPRGATVLDNPNGTAPGLYLEHDAHVVALLPGPPRELEPMFDALATDTLRQRAGRERFFREVLLITGRSESHVEEAIQPIYSRWRTQPVPIETTILASPGQIELQLTAHSDDEAAASAALAAGRDQIAEVLGRDVFSLDGRSLEEVVGELLRGRRFTIAVAESCTGGLLASRLTDVPGSSDYMVGGVVAYSNDLKVNLLGVPHELIASHGAVSEPVALALAEGIRKVTGASVGVGVTGVAGPGGGTPTKPVGTVAIAAVGPDRTIVKTLSFPGGRGPVKFQASQAALDAVRRLLST